ncbi:hypothetical protein VOLCADRAFT_104704, partial [Volvox carteri f. nagariensis]
MKTGYQSLVISSSRVPAGDGRTNQSLGDGELSLATTGRCQGSIPATNIHSKNWNKSTRLATISAQVLQDKENRSLPGSKKYQHVKSKLADYIRPTHNLKQAGAVEETGEAFSGGALQASPDVLKDQKAAVSMVKVELQRQGLQAQRSHGRGASDASAGLSADAQVHSPIASTATADHWSQGAKSSSPSSSDTSVPRDFDFLRSSGSTGSVSAGA